MTEQNLNILLRLNLEIDGALRTHAFRHTDESLALLNEKVTEFNALFNNVFLNNIIQESKTIATTQENVSTEGNENIGNNADTETIAQNTVCDATKSSDSVSSVQVILDEESLVDANVNTDNRNDSRTEIKIEKQVSVNDSIEKNDSLRVGDVMTIREAKDITKAFTLNDKFRFLRGLFCDNQTEFNDTLKHLSKLESLDEAYDYLLNDLEWDVENEEVQAFIGIIANHFNEV